MSIEVISKLKPKNNGSFPVIEDIDIEGGFQTRSDIPDRDSIPAANRKEGMRVYVVSTASTYQLGPGLTNSDWTSVTTTSSLLTLTAGENLVEGSICRINTSGQAVKANAGTGTVNDSRVIGISSSIYTAGNPAEFNSLYGSLIPTLFSSIPAAGDNGSPVYLSNSVSGEATLTPPDASGTVVFMIGILQGADGITSTPDVIFQPRLVAEIR